jgi:hypothetical protein
MDTRGEKLQGHTSNCPEGFGASLNEIKTSEIMPALQTSSHGEQIAKKALLRIYLAHDMKYGD